MKKAYILVQCLPGRAIEVANAIREKPTVTAADVVTGPTDVIATIEALDPEGVARTVLVDIAGIPGVNRTTTCGVLSSDQVIPANAEPA